MRKPGTGKLSARKWQSQDGNPGFSLLNRDRALYEESSTLLKILMLIRISYTSPLL